MRLTVANFVAKGTRNEAARWSYWARRVGFRSVGAWLEVLAKRETKRQEIQGGYQEPDPPFDEGAIV